MQNVFPEDRRYAWMITRDYLAGPEDDDSQVGTTGPHDAPPDYVTALHAGKGKKFRMYDDDGILYYEGLYYSPLDDPDATDELAFGPLWDYGTPAAGAVEIQYRRGNKWVTL